MRGLSAVALCFFTLLRVCDFGESLFSSTCTARIKFSTDAARAAQVKQAEREYQQLGRRVLAHHPCATRWRQRYMQLRPSSALHALPRPESDRQAYAGGARISVGLA